jgi:drug/metabolite transporter (DMT)-like permease
MSDPAANRRGILLMVTAMVVFAFQDAISKHLATHYSPVFVTMIRYWFFALFVVALSARRAGGLKAVMRTRHPALQCIRGALLAFEIVVMITGFALLGLVESHAIFAGYTLMVTALSGPVLGEQVGWRRWLAILVGFAGVLVILRPGAGVMDVRSLIPLLATVMFAVYHLATRYVNRNDGAATSFFYTGVAGAVAMTLVGPFFWTPMVGWDWGWMLLLSISGMTGHYLLISALDSAEASAIQPFAYLQLVFASAIGVGLFGERLDAALLIGGTMVVGAGLFTWWRERRLARAARGGPGQAPSGAPRSR